MTYDHSWAYNAYDCAMSRWMSVPASRYCTRAQTNVNGRELDFNLLTAEGKEVLDDMMILADMVVQWHTNPPSPS